MNPDANGWYRVHANDGSGLDFSTTVYVPEIHVLVDEPAADVHGNPYPPSAAVVVSEPKSADKSSAKKPEEAAK